MNPRPSIRQRLSQVLIMVSMAWGLGVAGVVWLTVQHEVDDLLDDSLQEAAEVMYGMLVLQGAQLPLREGATLPAPPHDEGLVWQIVSEGQQVMLRSHRAPLAALLPAATPGLSSVSLGAGWRVYGMPFGTERHMLYVAQRAADRREARHEVAGVAAACALLVGLLCAAWLRVRVRRELVPVNDLSVAVASYEPLDSRSTLAMPTRAELVPMHQAIVELGARLARRVANERAFSAHAAHALRTPLAGMDAQLAVALRECPPELKPRLQRTREAAGRLRRVVTALLTLFRSGVDVHWTAVNLAELLQRLPIEGLAVDVEPAVVLQADPDLLSAALLNLLDNALRHQASRVRVHARVEATGATITLHDNGEGIADERRRAMQAALDAQDYEAHVGLGLLLTDMVVRAHHGRLTLLADTSGCAVELRLGLPNGTSSAAV